MKPVIVSPLSRRAFLVASGGTCCGVLFAGSVGALAAKAEPQYLAASNWVTIHADGWVEIVCPGIELGQGTSTTLPRFLAEELDADWDRVRVVPAPLDEKKFGNPLFWGDQITAGSRTCLGYFDVLRIAGAQARYVLMTAAARKWQVDRESLSTERSVVVHRSTGRRVSYGDLVSIAKVPDVFPDFVSPGEKVQSVDEFFGEPPPSVLVAAANKAGAIRMKSKGDYNLIGRDCLRRDIPDKTRGSTEYGIDVNLPDMVFATVTTGAVLGEVPGKIDDKAARLVPGVLDIVRLPYGVAVVGIGTASVFRAQDLLSIDWTPGPRKGAYDSDLVMAEAAATAADGKSGVRAWAKGGTDEIERAFARSKRITFDARSELVYHAPIEPQNATVRIAADGKSAEVWVGTQWPRLEQEAVAKVLGIPAGQVTLHMVVPGGSFGRRQEPGAVIDAAYIAKAVRRPVKILWSRQEDLKRNPFRQAMACHVEAAVDDAGKITALRHRIVADSWFARMFPDMFEQFQQSDPGNWVGARCVYDVPLQLVDSVTMRRDVDVCYMRGIGVTQVKFAQESLVELAALQSGVDPLAYRKAMLTHEPRAIAVLDAVASASSWPSRRAKATPDRALGIAYTPYSNAHAALVADVSIDRESGAVTVHEIWCAVDVGFVAQPDVVASQIEGGILQGLSVALYEQVTLRKGAVQESSFADYKLLRLSAAPTLNVHVLPTDNPIAGVGEIGLMQIAPAINGALLRMTGKVIHCLPMSPDKVLEVFADGNSLPAAAA